MNKKPKILLFVLLGVLIASYFYYIDRKEREIHFSGRISHIMFNVKGYPYVRINTALIGIM